MQKSKHNHNNQALSILIFGGTGDLAMHALYLSIQALQDKKLLPQQLYIVAFAKAEIDTSTLQKKICRQLEDEGINTQKAVDFAEQIQFVHGSFENKDDYIKLDKILDELEGDTLSNRILYLATPPRFFVSIIQTSAEVGLLDTRDDNRWVRIGIEKPFGENFKQALELETCVHHDAQNAEIFHIDHYLNKEMTASVLFLRFSNALFNPLWSSQYIESIEVVFDEQEGIGHRAQFYDSVGAIRDVGQNHIMTLLATVLMDTPDDFDHQVMSSLRSQALEGLHVDQDKVSRYQYADYGDVSDIEQDSQTETYFTATLSSTDNKWQGTDISIRGGKGVARDEVAIHIHFHDETCLCLGEAARNRVRSNTMVFRYKPQEDMKISLWNKQPGVSNELEEIDWILPYGEHHEHKTKLGNTYERVLYDIAMGDQTLFAHTNELMEAWRLVDQIQESCQAQQLQIYERGSHPLHK